MKSKFIQINNKSYIIFKLLVFPTLLQDSVVCASQQILIQDWESRTASMKFYQCTQEKQNSSIQRIKIQIMDFQM